MGAPFTGRNRVAAHTMFNTLLGTIGAESLPVSNLRETSAWAVLDQIGVDMILNQLSTGRLPAEVALLYEVPILYFRSWMRERLTPEEIDEAREAAAEALQVKALLTLSARLHSPAEASQAKALSDRFAKISEALSPKNWSPARIEAPGSVPSVSITFNMPGVAPGGKPDKHIEASVDAHASTETSGVESAALQAGLSPGPDLFQKTREAMDLLDRTDPWTAVGPRRAMSEGLE